ncbi:MAG: hypothetical protein AAF702_21235 [Chloroflexota bacterium]
MSWQMQIFFNSTDNAKVTLSKLAALWQISFQECPGSNTFRFFRYSGLGLSIYFFDQHDLEDDINLEFSKYSYQLEIEAHSPTHNYKKFVHEATHYWATQMFRQYGWKSMIVEDVQKFVTEIPDPSYY